MVIIMVKNLKMRLACLLLAASMTGISAQAVMSAPETADAPAAVLCAESRGMTTKILSANPCVTDRGPVPLPENPVGKAAKHPHSTEKKKQTKPSDDGFSQLRLCPGGQVFGVRMYTPGIMVVRTCEVMSETGRCTPAETSGLTKKDLITHIDGKEVHSMKDVTAAVENCGGKALSFTVSRSGQALTLSVQPVLSKPDGKYRIGVFVRDRTAGIGTVTFIHPETGVFGGLGHGICDGDTGALVPLSRGLVTDVHLQGVVKGLAGDPGELRGALGVQKLGMLSVNSEAGVFGMLAEKPAGESHPALPLARASEVKTGKATIYCTLADGECRPHDIEITKIHGPDRDTKCFSIRVTDEELLSVTGGIVQGMSGSPIVQNGKLVGAVTHVLLNDPTGGYGIFIEKMLSALPEALSIRGEDASLQMTA